MYRIDNASSSASLPAPTADGPFPGHYFVDKNPAQGVEGTIVPAEWFNAITEEIANVITAPDGGNTSLNKASRTQLKQAILTMLSNSNSGIPAGTLMYWTDSVLPDAGWDWADGGELNRVTQSRLFLRIGTRFGIGDGVTTYNKPDARGVNLLGLDNMGGNPANRVTSASLGGANSTTIGGRGGEQTHILTVNEMPAHSHPFVAFTTSGTGASNGSGNGPQGGVTDNTGGGQAHNNMGPWMALPVIIKL